MTDQEYRHVPTIGGRYARQTGQLGDLYEVDSRAAEYAESRKGHGDKIPALQAGDVLMREAYSGDCFGYYVVFRDKCRLDDRWCGYDGVGTYVGNAIHPDGPGGVVQAELDAYCYEPRGYYTCGKAKPGGT